MLLAVSFFFAIMYNLIVLVKQPIFYYPYTLVMFGWLMISYYLLGDMMSKIFYVVGISLCLPMISHPFHLLPDSIQWLISDGVMDTDRIQIRAIILACFGLFLLIDVGYLLWIRRSLMFLLVLLSVGLLLLISLSHSYHGLSVLQVILDLGQLFGCISAWAYFRVQVINDQLAIKASSLFETLFIFLCLIIAIDVTVTLSGSVPWTTSFRGGLQGLFFGMETTFAFSVGLVLAFILSKLRLSNGFFIVLLSFGLWVLLESNVKTAVGGVILATIVIRFFGYSLGKRLIIPALLLGGAALTLSILNIEDAASLAVRIATYVSYISLLGDDYNWLHGIAPGITSYEMVTNLAVQAFRLDFTAPIMGLPEAFIEELVLRESMSEGGAFLPHNTGLALVCSYGVIMLLPVIYYFFVAPYRSLRKIDFTNKFSFTLTAVTIYMLSFLQLHPFLILLPLIVFTELIIQHSRQVD